MHYLPFWQGALVLATVPVLHWALLKRTFAVSGRLTALVDRMRDGAPTGEPEMSEADLLAAIRAETSMSFGESSIEPVETASGASRAALPSAADPSSVHVLFFVGLTLGGLVAALTGGSFAVVPTLHGELFSALLGHSRTEAAFVLFTGGTLVGFGTRMASGCTSGHGLCGVSQLQKGSLLATCAFFGMGVVTSFLVAAVS